jgi:membrane protein DedA with SNARE-associated domain
MAHERSALIRIGALTPRRSLGAAAALALLAILAFVFLIVEDGNLPDAVGDVGPLTRTLIHTFGGAAAFVLLYIEESGVPMVIPGDFVVMWVGNHVPHQMTAWVAAWLGLTAMVVLGSSNLYFISRRWGRSLLDRRLARILHLTPQRMERAEGWFVRWGAWALIFGRHIFGLRVPLTVAAGIFRLPYPTFALSVAVSSAAWIAMFLFLGVAVGGHVARALHVYQRAVIPAALAVVALAVVVLAIRLAMTRNRLV